MLLRRSSTSQRGPGSALGWGLFLAVLSGSAASAGDPPPPARQEVRCSGDSCSLGACVSQALLDDAASALSPLRLLPMMQGGQAIGFKLFGIRDGSLAARLGLQNGDVATRLNDRSLAGPEPAAAALKAASEATTLRLSLLRAGQPIERRVVLDRRKPAPGECPPPPTPQSPPPAASEPVQKGSGLADLHCRALRCTCKAEVRDRLLADSDLFLHGARFVPEIVQGKPMGFRLLGVRRGSIYAHVGLQNGDLVEKIAGQPLDNPEGALAAYTQVRSRNPITVDFRRRGTAMTLTVDVEH